MTEEELACMAKLEEQIKKIMEMMSTMVKGKAKEGEGSGTLDNPIPLHSDTGVYHEDLSLQALSVTIQIQRVNELPTNEEPREVDKGKSIMDEDAHKFSLIEERLKAIEGLDTFRSEKAKGLCLVPDVVVPPKFKVPDFEKFNGSSCPITHIIMYCRKMVAHSKDEKLLIHIFQDSLTGFAARWYVKLDKNQIRTWGELGRAFIAQYKHITDMAPDRLALQNMKKESNESFKECAQWWRDLASQVQPPLMAKGTTILFVGMLKGIYYDRMVGNASKTFTDMVLSEEMIENTLKSGKIYDLLRMKRGVAGKKKEAETQTIVLGGCPYSYIPHPSPIPSCPQYPVVNATNTSPFMYRPPVPVTNPAMLTMPTRSPQTQALVRMPWERPMFDPIPISYADRAMNVTEMVEGNTCRCKYS